MTNWGKTSSVGEASNDWRTLFDGAVALMVQELNKAIDAQEFGMINALPGRGGLDFWFGERVFRFIFRPNAPDWIPGHRVEAVDVLFVHRRLAREPI
jgi:hypothetical protein